MPPSLAGNAGHSVGIKMVWKEAIMQIPGIVERIVALIVAAGYKPGPSFGKALQKSYEVQMDGVTDRAELLATAIEVLIA